MANAKGNFDPISTVAAEVIQGDEVLQHRLKNIIHSLLNDMEHIIKWGTVTQRTQLMKQVMPQLLRSMKTADANDDDKALMEAHDRIMAEIRGDGDSQTSD